MRKNRKEEGTSRPCEAVIWRQEETAVLAVDLLRLKLRKLVSQSLALAYLREKAKAAEEKQPRILVVSGETWSRLEQNYAIRQGRNWWKGCVEPYASSAALMWCLCRPNCSIALLKQSKAKWTVLGVGETADLTSIRCMFLCLLRDLNAGSMLKIGEITVHSPDFHPSLAGLVVASDLIQQVKTTGKIHLIAPIPSYPVSQVYEDVLSLVRTCTGLTVNELKGILNKCETEMASRYLESTEASKVGSPGTDTSTLSLGYHNSTDLPNEPTSPLPLSLSPPLPDSDSEPSAPFTLLSLASPQAANSGPCPSWTFLPPSDRHEEGSEIAEGTRRITTEGSEEREELVYLQYSEDEKDAMSPICEEKEEEAKTWSAACGEEVEDESQAITPRLQLVPVVLDFQLTAAPFHSEDPLESPRIVSPIRLSFPESPGASSAWRTAEVDTNDTGKFHKACPSAEGCDLL